MLLSTPEGAVRVAICGQKVMLDRDSAALSAVETRALAQAVKRNRGRFPPDFMFQVTRQEVRNLRSQALMSSTGGRRFLLFVFAEQGVPRFAWWSEPASATIGYGGRGLHEHNR